MYVLVKIQQSLRVCTIVCFLFFLTAQSATLLKARYTNGVGLTSTDNIEENSEIILDCTFNEFTVDAIRSIELGTDDPDFIYQVL